MIQLVAATNNAGKLTEFRRILAPLGFEVLSLADVGLEIEVDETAHSFAGNARLKAQAVFDRCGMTTLADDSGLCVDALNGAPGIYSARYGGLATDRERYERVLMELSDVPRERRGARFVCALCCILGRDITLECSGECEGEIGLEPSGGGGFGYDPIFYVNGKSYSDLSGDEKDRLSHRGVALENLRALLGQYIRNLD